MVLLRRFRSRVLAAVLFIGTAILICAYYGPGDPVLVRVPDPGRLWTLLWPVTEKCPVRSPAPASSQRWDTADLYPELDFSVPDNGGMGFWNDVLEKRYRKIRNNWKDLPLEVIIVPHSHVDPGWLRTFEDYHHSSVTYILDNMVTFLDKNDDFKFIWSEISFFAKWWEKQSGSTRDTVKKILHRRQLEFTTAGWVMPDEAVTHYFAVIDQLVEGHQWLKHFVGAVPENGWSVDVFGHSGSYPYILSSSGISKMIIMRVHYAWKKFLAMNQSLDFYWEQHFPSRRVLSHMAPSDLYSYKYACGPDPQICLKFDFRRVDREYSESTADKITDENVEMKAGYLLSQYGRFASLFPHNVLLVPLGDDFRYNVKIEWDQQLQNYRKLFDFINNKKELHAHLRFGTPADYFQEVERRMKNNTNKTLISVLGDFLPYADTYANARPSYWTGFYTTRPFYKKLSQELEYWLRTAEILYSFAKTLASYSSRDIILKDYSFLISARQKLALFQHHDAVTGTSKEMVMRDYGQKLHSGIIDAMSVTSHATQLLLMESATKGKTWTSQVYPDVYRSSFDQPTRKLSISVPNNGRKIIIFNSLTVERTEIVRIKVKSPLIKVVDLNMNNVPFQINPVFRNELSMSSIAFELYFVVSLRPLSFTSYTIIRIQENERQNFPKTIVSLSLNNDALASHVNSAFTFEKPQSKNIHFDSSKMKATFLHSGELKTIYLKENGLSQALDIDILTYRPWIYRSGAYLFCPESPDATSMINLTNHFPLVSIIRGHLMSELRITYNDFLTSSIRMYHFKDAPVGLHLEVISDVSKMSGDKELILRIKSDILNEGIFFTDSNGFQMVKRKYVSNLPVQANYYPATSNIFIEDNNMRLNVLLPHSHGVTASDGKIEILLDRKNHYDDGRGVSEGIEDSRTFSSSFWILPEPHVIQKSSVHLTSDAFQQSLFLQHPPTILVSEYSEMELIKNYLSFIDESWPSDVHLVNLRSLPLKVDYNLPSNDSLMIIYQRSSLFCNSKDFIYNFLNDVGKHSPFGPAKVKSAIRTSLTGIHTHSTKDIEFNISSSPLQTCKITFEGQK